MRQRLVLLAATLLIAGSVGSGQSINGVRTAEAMPFIGTWVLAMTNPEGTTETVKVWDNNGTIAASVQAGKFPLIQASGVFRDRDMLLLTANRFENGKPIWAVIALTLEGDTMAMAQILQFSQTIKRGTGKKQ